MVWSVFEIDKTLSKRSLQRFYKNMTRSIGSRTGALQICDCLKLSPYFGFIDDSPGGHNISKHPLWVNF